MFYLFRRICSKKYLENLINYSLRNLSSAPFTNGRFLPVSSVFKHNLQIYRLKSKGDKKQIESQISETEPEETNEDNIFELGQDKHTKIQKIHVNSMRLDAILKAGLGLSRNKIEVMFYESKIRLNGEKVMKKSVSVQEGDEIDIIKGVNSSNPDFLTVARVEVLSATGKDEHISVKIRRCKTLTVENYRGRNCWQP